MEVKTRYYKSVAESVDACRNTYSGRNSRDEIHTLVEKRRQIVTRFFESLGLTDYAETGGWAFTVGYDTGNLFIASYDSLHSGARLYLSKADAIKAARKKAVELIDEVGR